MRGINPAYLAKLDEGQRAFILSSYGKHFADNFLFIKAEHGYVIGPTGSGKTNKNHNLANWLKHTETILWISASKDNDIIPLLFMGLPVNIITLTNSDIEIRHNRERYEPHPTVTYVNEPHEVFRAIKNDYINILEVRNAFWDRGALLDWMIGFWQTLADWTRRGMMPRIAPPSYKGAGTRVSVFLDESQWLIAGSKVTNDPKRVKATEIITESALEIRTYGWRLIISAQGFTNVPPIIRENMACAFLCANADVPAEMLKLRKHCAPGPHSIWKRPSQFKRNEYKFVDREGNAHPNHMPLPVPLYPKSEEDRELAERMSVYYARRYHDQADETEQIDYPQPFPELGKLSAVTMPEERQTDQREYSRYSIPSGDY